MYFKNYKVKALYLIPPLLKISFYTIIGLALFRWIFSIYFNLFEINEEYWEYWLPLFLPGLPVYIWLSPRLKILISKNANYEGGLTLMAWLFIAFTGVVLQKNITAATAEELSLTTVNQITKYEPARYYYLNRFSVDTSKTQRYTAMLEGGLKKNTELTMYFVVPFKSDGTNKNSLKYWYGIKFKETIPKSFTEAQKNEAFRYFITSSNRSIYGYDYNSPDHFERIPKSADRENFYIALKQQIKNADDSTNVILKPIFEPLKDFNSSSFIYVFYSYTAALALFMFLLIFPRYSARMHKKNPTYQLYVDWFKKVFYIK